MASISKVVAAVYSRWHLFRVVVWLGAVLRLAGWLGGSLATLMFGGLPNWRSAVGGGQRSAVVGDRPPMNTFLVSPCNHPWDSV